MGVVGAIIPWNGPLVLSCGKIDGALATGCMLVLNPAEQTPLAALRFAELCLEAGVPPGVVNVVPATARRPVRRSPPIWAWKRWRSPARTSPARRS